VQSEQLPTESQVFEDEVLAGKELMIHPRRCRSDTIRARISSELSEFSITLRHSFCGRTTFWRDTGVFDMDNRQWVAEELASQLEFLRVIDQ
jgi:hypothetical protein